MTHNLDLEAVARQLRRDISRCAPDCLQVHSVVSYVRAVESLPASLPYNYLDPGFKSMDEAILAKWGVGLLEKYHELALIELFQTWGARIRRQGAPIEIHREYARICKSVARQIADNDHRRGLYVIQTDSWWPYWTYLGLASLRIIPLGSHLIVPRLVRVMNSKLRRPPDDLRSVSEEAWIFERHVCPSIGPTTGLLNLDDYRKSLRLAALMFRSRPEFVAMIGSCWLYDPELPHITPRLSFIQSFIRETGGILFREGVGEKVTKQALQKSRARRELFRQGKYQPVGYTGILLKEKLLSWLERTN